MIALAAVLWSTSGFFAKAPWFDSWPVESRGLMLGFWRSLFAVLILAPFVRRPQWHPALISMCLCFGCMVWAFMTAMINGPAANAIWLQYLAPAWVMLLGVLLLGERVTGSDVRMLSFCLAGVLLILGMELRSSTSLFATSMGILSGIAFAGVVLHMRFLRQMESTWLISLNHSATVLILLPWAWRQPGSVAMPAYAALAFFGVFQMSIPYLLFARGVRSVGSPEASVLTLLEPILVPLWVYIAWHHHASYQAPPWWTWLGGSLILMGLLIRYLPAVVQVERLRERMKRVQS
jgi:DME family drug/metabolite transporter